MEIEKTRGAAMMEEYGGGPRCPHCKSSNVEIEEEEKGDHGFTTHPAQGVCYDCGHAWRA